MRKIDSIGYGHKIVGLAAVFLVGLPVCLCLLKLVFRAAILSALIRISLILGALAGLFLAGVLSIEFYQDRKIDRKYTEVKKKKLPLGNGVYECQSCGSRQVTLADKNCGICGMKFDAEGN